MSKFIRIGIADKNDNPPYFDKSLYEAEVDENEDIQHTVLTVTANDKDECKYRNTKYFYLDLLFSEYFSWRLFKRALGGGNMKYVFSPKLFFISFFRFIPTMNKSVKDNLQINLHYFPLFDNIETSDAQTSHNLNFIKKYKKLKKSYERNF